MKNVKIVDTVERERERERATIYSTWISQSVSKKNYTEELDRIKINEDLSNGKKLSLICDIKKIKRTSYLKVVREKEKLKLQIDSLSFFWAIKGRIL